MSLAILLRIQEKQILFTYLPYERMQWQFIWGKNQNFGLIFYGRRSNLIDLKKYNMRDSLKNISIFLF